MLFQQNNRYKYLSYISLVSVLLIILTTSARGATLSLFIVSLIFYFKSIKSQKNKISNLFRLLFKIVFLIGIFVFLSRNVPLIYSKLEVMTERFLSLFQFFLENEQDISVSERSIVYDEFFNNLGDYLFGKYKYLDYPHNIFLEIFMRWGIFGLPLIFLLIKNLFKSIKNITNENLKGNNSLLFLFSALFLFSFLQSLTSLNLEMNRSLWISLGFLMGFRMSKKIV